jgi:hypothetical protein
MVGPLAGEARSSKMLPLRLLRQEYVAFHAVVKEAKWLRLLTPEFGQGDNPVIVFCDNAWCIAKVEKPTASSHVKIIDVAYHLFRDQVAVGYIEHNHDMNSQHHV